MFLIFLLSALSASTFTIGKIVLDVTPPIFLIGVRILIAGLLFFGYYWLTHKKMPKLDRYDKWILAQTAFFSFFLGFILEFWALQYMPSGKTAFLYSLSPIVAAIMSYFAFHEKMTWKKVIGLLIAFFGFLPVLMETTPEEGREFFLISFPELALLGGVITFAYGWIVIRKGLRHHVLPASFISGIGMIFGGLMALITAYLFEIPSMTNKALWVNPYVPITEWKAFILGAAGLIIIGNVLCYMLYAHLLKKYTATLLTLGELTTPLFAVFYGWLFLGEKVHWYFFPSIGILFVGMYLFFNEEKRLGYYQ